MRTNEFFNTAGSNRNRQVVCADGFKMSVQAFAGGYCTPRVDGADKYEEVEVGYPSEPEELLMGWAEEPDKPTQTRRHVTRRGHSHPIAHTHRPTAS